MSTYVYMSYNTEISEKEKKYPPPPPAPFALVWGSTVHENIRNPAFFSADYTFIFTDFVSKLNG